MYLNGLNKFANGLNKFANGLNKFTNGLNKFTNALNKLLNALNKLLNSSSSKLIALNSIFNKQKNFTKALYFGKVNRIVLGNINKGKFTDALRSFSGD